jgi:calcium-dependent protein kinase
VRKAKHIESGEARCIKIFSKQMMSKQHTQRIYYEINLLKTFDHPNIVKVYEWFEDAERIYMVQERLVGGDLHERIVNKKTGRWEEEEIASIIQQILYAVNYLHKNCVVHRDIKPENILFLDRETLRLKLIDFGTA